MVQDEGTVKADQAAVDAAKLNLVYAHIVSPISGRAGLQQVNLGNYITPSEPNGLVVIAQLKPITAMFSLPEDQIPPLLVQLHAGKTLPVTAWDRTHTNKLATGVLQSIDSTIDPTTGTLKMKASFANEEETLFPQQFVNIELLLNTLQGVVLVPQSAIQRGAPGTYVYVVNQDETVSLRKVTLGPGNANDIVVQQGLKAGETVVTDGADKLKDGAKVSLRRAGAPPGAGRCGGRAVRVQGPGPTPAPPGRRGGADGSRRSGAGPVSRTTDEPVPHLHPAPRRHHAADGGDPAGRDRGLSDSCRCRRCRRSTTRPSRCRPSIRARARR